MIFIGYDDVIEQGRKLYPVTLVRPEHRKQTVDRLVVVFVLLDRLRADRHPRCASCQSSKVYGACAVKPGKWASTVSFGQHLTKINIVLYECGSALETVFFFIRSLVRPRWLA